MKLLGVEFENFAGFEKAFVPLDKPISVLVGKNNAGKTALLNGLLLLNALPVKPPKGFPDHVSSYARFPNQGILFHVRLLPSGNDSPLLSCTEQEWKVLVEARNPEIDFLFRAQQSRVTLEVCNLVLEAKTWPLMTRKDGSLRWIVYNVSGSPIRENPIQGSSDGFEPLDLFGALPPLRIALPIQAHRVATPQMPLQAMNELSPNAQNLAQFLDTLQGNDRDRFDLIDRFMNRVFPEFRRMNLEKSSNGVAISFTLTNGGRKVRLPYCGTGVEQLLSLAAFVLGREDKRLFLLDEPHSYLHPAAERELIAFLQSHPGHQYVIATHSPVVMNAIPPDGIVHLDAEKDLSYEGYGQRKGRPDIASVLQGVGYRNSDFLLNDRLIFVEGESDQSILPILLGKCQQFDEFLIRRTGFPTLGGHDPSSIIMREKLLRQLGQVNLPRVYLLDGDCTPDERRELEGIMGGTLKVRFLELGEVENYLLMAGAIATAIREQGFIEGKALDPTDEQVQAKLAEVRAHGDAKPAEQRKGSVILKKLYSHWELRYDKHSSGSLIARHVTLASQPALAEIADKVADVLGG